MSIWFMYDNHTFIKLSDDPHKAAVEALKIFDTEDKYGFVGCKEGHVGGTVNANGDRNRFVKGLDEWADSVKIESKIKPCPHCGGAAKINDTKRIGSIIYCPKCAVRWFDRDKMIEAWNKRI